MKKKKKSLKQKILKQKIKKYIIKLINNKINFSFMKEISIFYTFDDNEEEFVIEFEKYLEEISYLD